MTTRTPRIASTLASLAVASSLAWIPVHAATPASDHHDSPKHGAPAPAPAPTAHAAHSPKSNPSGKLLRDASLMLLKEGNDRYVAGKTQHPNGDSARRISTASGQEPFASILSCSDSRAPVELLFDRGLGDLFVVRVAGNIAGESELASLEYGVGHLNTPVLVVLGHTKCGAVTAIAKGAELHGHLHTLKDLIEPAAEKARADATSPEDLVPRAIQANVWNMMERLIRESDVIREKVETGSAHVVGAIYDLETGRVSWLGAHPAQDAIVALANQARTDAALANSKKSFAPSTTPEPSIRSALDREHGHGPGKSDVRGALNSNSHPDDHGHGTPQTTKAKAGSPTPPAKGAASQVTPSSANGASPTARTTRRPPPPAEPYDDVDLPKAPASTSKTAPARPSGNRGLADGGARDATPAPAPTPTPAPHDH